MVLKSESGKCPTCGYVLKVPVWKQEEGEGERVFQGVDTALKFATRPMTTAEIAKQVKARKGLVYSVLCEMKRRGTVLEGRGKKKVGEQFASRVWSAVR